MSGASKRWLAAVLLVGLGVRLALAFGTVGVAFDIRSAEIVERALRDDPFDLYSYVNSVRLAPGIFLFRWPYLPAFLPWIALAGQLSRWTGLPFHGLVKLPSVAADVGLAWLVQDHLGRRGCSDRTRLAAAALVALGPSFAVISGHAVQIDSVAILPAAVAVSYWERSGPRTRAPLAGALAGLGAALKIVPGLVVLALLPTARAARERVVLMAAAVAVPVALSLPFLVADPSGLFHLRHYTGVPGLGGLSLFVQPGLVEGLLANGEVSGASSLTLWLMRHGSLITTVGVMAVMAVALVCHSRPMRAAAILWLALYVFGTGYAHQYLVWGIPFFLMAGFLREVAVLQALAFVPTLLYYAHLDFRYAPTLYVAFMSVMWVGFAIALVVLLRQEWASRLTRPVTNRSL